MANDLAGLAQALRQGSAAQAQLGGLQQRAQTAQGMADTPYATINPNTGYGSPLQAIANALRKDRGRKQLEEIQPQMADLQQQIGGADVARTMYDAQRQADETTYDRSRNAAGDLIEAEEREWQREAPARALSLATKKYEMKGGEATPGKYENVETGQVATLTVNDRTGGLELDGQPVKGSEWTKYERPLSTGKGKGSGTGNEALDTESNMFPSLVESFNDDYANPLWGLPFAGEARNLMAREAPITTSDKAEEAQKWWSDFETLYNLPTRHEMFGSALTQTEKGAWRNATINPNMNADQIREKLNTLLSIQRAVVDRNYINPESGLRGATGSYGEPAPKGGYPVPAGVAQAHWDDLSPDEQQEYLEMQGEL